MLKKSDMYSRKTDSNLFSHGRVAEIMGRKSGAVSGIGGSQNLVNKNFFGNG